MKTLYFKLTLCFFLLLAGNATQGIWAQQEPIQIAGIVLDEHGDPLWCKHICKRERKNRNYNRYGW